MTSFLKSRLGLGCVAGFVLLMGFALQRVTARRAARQAPPQLTGAAVPPAAAKPTAAEAAGKTASPPATPARPKPAGWSGAVENAAYLDTYLGLAQNAREDQDGRGNRITRRRTTRSTEAIPPAAEEAPVPPVPTRGSLRLQGSEGRSARSTEVRGPSQTALPDASGEPVPPAPPTREARKSPRRFNPYGRVIKCELVFTIDSANEQTPLVGLVMEPVYNNGVLVIPAGAELHGVARPDRLRDRLFSGTDWVLVFPREGTRPNGRQLNVRGVALQREDPEATGLTWGLTDGSYGLEGRVIRSQDQAEIKRFLATFLAAGAVTLQERDARGRGSSTTVRNSPQNAALQGVAANLERYAADIAAEIEAHGVFIRVPAGHQFYFYPTQVIDAEAAGVSADVATVK